MIDNINKIKPFIKPESEDDFYYLQILQRKKENPHLGSNSRVIKTYYINSIDYLESRYEEIKLMCNTFNARAMINLNKRSYYKTAFKSMENVAGIMANKHFNKIHKAYDSACGQGHNDPEKKWILDIDDIYDDWFYKHLHDFITKKETGSILECIPSASGYHIITTPFRLDRFKLAYPNIEVQKNNPTNLYIP